MHHGPGDGQSLLLAAGQPFRETAPTVTQTDVIQQFQSLIALFDGRQTVQFQGEQQIFLDGQGWDKIEKLKHEADMTAAEKGAFGLAQTDYNLIADPDGSGIRQVDAAEQVQQSGFAGAGLSEQGNELASVDIQIQVGEDDSLIIAFGVVFAQVANRDENCWRGLYFHYGYRLVNVSVVTIATY